MLIACSTCSCDSWYKGNRMPEASRSGEVYSGRRGQIPLDNKFMSPNFSEPDTASIIYSIDSGQIVVCVEACNLWRSNRHMHPQGYPGWLGRAREER